MSYSGSLVQKSLRTLAVNNFFMRTMVVGSARQSQYTGHASFMETPSFSHSYPILSYGWESDVLAANRKHPRCWGEQHRVLYHPRQEYSLQDGGQAKLCRPHRPSSWCQGNHKSLLTKSASLWNTPPWLCCIPTAINVNSPSLTPGISNSSSPAPEHRSFAPHYAKLRNHLVGKTDIHFTFKYFWVMFAHSKNSHTAHLRKLLPVN